MSPEYSNFLQTLVKNLPAKTLIVVVIQLGASPSLVACPNGLMGSPGTLPKTRGKAPPFHSTFFLHLFVANSTFNNTIHKIQKHLFFCCFNKFCSVLLQWFFFWGEFSQTCYLPNWKGIFAQITFLIIKSCENFKKVLSHFNTGF